MHRQAADEKFRDVWVYSIPIPSLDRYKFIDNAPALDMYIFLLLLLPYLFLFICAMLFSVIVFISIFYKSEVLTSCLCKSFLRVCLFTHLIYTKEAYDFTPTTTIIHIIQIFPCLAIETKINAPMNDDQIRIVNIWRHIFCGSKSKRE